MLVLKSENSSIPVLSLKDGEIAVITNWAGDSSYSGRVVQRYGDSLISLGAGYGNSWSALFKQHTSCDYTKCYVRLVRPGETFVLE